MPDDLREFYALHEGVGLESSSDRPVRLCQMKELSQVRLQDLGMFKGYEPFGGWASFAAIRIASSCFGDEIVYVLRAPVCPAGSIVAFGCDISGPAGSGDETDIPGSLVLAADFQSWLTRLARDAWNEYGFVPGEIDNLPEQRAGELRRHFRVLNPEVDWAAPPGD
jgi:hypothetical protein